MIKRVSIGLVALLLASTGVVHAGTYTLHPSGFGPHSYASWKAGEGQPDSNGNKDQALYFQKSTSTATPSFCLREPAMMPSTGETSEKSRPIARIM